MKQTWRASVQRNIDLVVCAESEEEARQLASDLAWEWQPEDADGGDQGSVHILMTWAATD